MVTVTEWEDTYRALRAVEPARRSRWLRERVPTDLRGRGWLVLIERAEFDASTRRGLPYDMLRENVAFLVDLIEMAVQDGMPPYYAARRLALVTLALLRAGHSWEDFPDAVNPDHFARRVLSTFRLRPEDALAVTERVDAETPADEDTAALSEIQWAIPDLAELAPHLTDGHTAHHVREWLEISAALLR